MDAFEQLVADLLRHQGFWTYPNYKVDLDKAEKKQLNTPSMPRPELDILAYKPVTNTLFWIECKSYLDSPGVPISAFIDEKSEMAVRYRVFTNLQYREVVTAKLKQQAVANGLCLPDPNVQYCLVAGKIKGPREPLHKQFNEHGWLLYDDIWLREQLHKLARIGYENNTAVMVAKLFSRDAE